MPAKSRRNRRNISHDKRMPASPAVSAPIATAQAEVIPPEKTVSISPVAKPVINPVDTNPYITRELKRIGLITLLIAIIMALLYLFLS